QGLQQVQVFFSRDPEDVLDLLGLQGLDEEIACFQFSTRGCGCPWLRRHRSCTASTGNDTLPAGECQKTGRAASLPISHQIYPSGRWTSWISAVREPRLSVAFRT